MSSIKCIFPLLYPCKSVVAATDLKSETDLEVRHETGESENVPMSNMSIDRRDMVNVVRFIKIVERQECLHAGS